MGSTLFQTTSNEKMSKVTIFASVLEKGLDIRYLLLRKEEYQRVFDWWKATNINQNQIGLVRERYASPQPAINPIFDRQSNIMEKAFDLPSNETFALVYDNTYSAINSKTIQIKIEIQSRLESIENLPLITELKDKIPTEIYEEITDANDCYTCGHFRQSAIMLRKALDTSLRIKALQNGIQEKLYDSNGNEIQLSDKIKLLITEKLITPRLASDIETIKWYGDHGVHGKMKIIITDVKEIDRKLRNVLSNLNLKL